MGRHTRKTGQGPATRGRHKRHVSRETRRWLRMLRRGDLPGGGQHEAKP